MSTCCLRGVLLETSIKYFPCWVLFTGEKPNALAEPRGEEESLTKKGKKKKTVHWAEEEQLKHYFYFDLDETERGKAGGSNTKVFESTFYSWSVKKQLLMLLYLIHSQCQQN